MKQRQAIRLVAALLVGGSLLLLTGWWWQMSGNAKYTTSTFSRSDALMRIYANCTSAMSTNACSVMGSSGTSAVTAERPVFVAGVGQIAASDYNAMYEAGDAMCSVVRDTCAAGWSSQRCDTAKKLWLH